MFVKDMNIGFLLDFYGEILSDRKRDVLDLYYNDDMSLAEIAEEIGISRQGVRDLIKKAEEELNFFESKLGLAEKFSEAQAHAGCALAMCDKYNVPSDLKEEIKSLSDTIS